MSWLGSTWCAVSLYLVVTLLAVIVGSIELAHRRARGDTTIRPAVWLGTAILLVVMAFGRATESGEFLADIGRREARLEGWYEGRRIVQLGVVGTTGAMLAAAVALLGLALWKEPARRHRYLPTIVVISALACYAAVRVVSLHQIDVIMQRHLVQGLKVGALIELALLISALVTLAVLLRPRHLLGAPDSRSRSDLRQRNRSEPVRDDDRVSGTTG